MGDNDDNNSSSNQEEEGKEKDDMTPEEREQWLRERGVKIETPQDRRRAAASGSTSGLTTIIDQMAGLKVKEEDTDDDGSVPFVYVPHDDTKPLRTLYLPKEEVAKGGDNLPDYVRKHFADSKSIDASLLKEQATKHFAGGKLEQLAETNLSAAAMNAVASQGQVETFVLVHPADTNNYEGVYIYLDEVGLLKKLPHNSRASQIATTCGYHPPPNFYGDVFIGRVKTRPIIHNVGFVAGVDTDRNTAVWMQRAVSENLAWQQEMNRIKGSNETQPSVIGTDGTEASERDFTWTQDDEEIEIKVKFDTLEKSKIKVSFMPKQINIKYDGNDHLQIKLYSGIDVDGCTWTIDGKNLVITCEKANGGGELWPRIIQ